jgi:GcrA cell cycle regulator
VSGAGWTAERAEQLRALVERGHSAAEIGAQLGVSKGAVVGKAFRMGLSLVLPQGGEGTQLSRRSAAGEPIALKSKAKPPAPARQAKVTSPEPEAPRVEPTQKLWPKPAGPDACDIVALDMVKQCRMPLWSDAYKGGLYCGRQIETEGKPWCAACARLVYGAQPRLSPLELMIARRRAANGQSARTGSFA